MRFKFPVQAEKKQHQVSLRLTETEYNKLKTYCTKNNMSRAKLIRKLLKDYI